MASHGPMMLIHRRWVQSREPHVVWVKATRLL